MVKRYLFAERKRYQRAPSFPTLAELEPKIARARVQLAAAETAGDFREYHQALAYLQGLEIQATVARQRAEAAAVAAE